MMDIARIIPFGRQKAISREMLSQLTGVSDRINRRAIERSRGKGNIIINLQQGEGYFRIDPDDLQPGDLETISRQYWANKHRALSILSYQKHLRAILKAHGMQV